MNPPKILRALGAALAIAAVAPAFADMSTQDVAVTLTLGSFGSFGGSPPEGYVALAVSPPPRARGTYTQVTVNQSTVNGPIPILSGEIAIQKVVSSDQGVWLMTYVPTGVGPNQSATSIRYTVKVVAAKPKPTPTPLIRPTPTPTPRKK